jgi:hypothetical protein
MRALLMHQHHFSDIRSQRGRIRLNHQSARRGLDSVDHRQRAAKARLGIGCLPTEAPTQAARGRRQCARVYGARMVAPAGS